MTNKPEKRTDKPRYMPTMTQDYSRTSDTARAVNSRVSPLIEAYIQSIAPQISGMPPERPFVIADFGTADGVNSSPLMAAIIAQLRSINSSLKVRLVYEDIAGREAFDKFWQSSQLAHIEGVEAEYIQRSFYDTCPEIAGKINIGLSSTAVHWLDTRNIGADFFQHPVNIQPNQLADAERHKFIDKWKKDWTNFLLKRKDEMVKGGALFMANLADFGNGEWPASAGYNYIRDICNEMCAEKLVPPEELRAIFVPDYFATPQEMKSVLAEPEIECSFHLEHFEPMTIPCAYYPQYQDRLDDPAVRTELGSTLAHEVRAWSESSIKTGLSPAHKDKVDEIYKRLEDKFCRAPKALPFQYCMMELTKV
jgi:hypothetical protein